MLWVAMRWPDLSQNTELLWYLWSVFKLWEIAVSIQPPATSTYCEELKRKAMNKLAFYYEAFEKVVQLLRNLLEVKIRQLKAMGVGMETSEA